jgi:hypothetical protein
MATIAFAGSWIAKGSHQSVWSAMGNADSGLPQSPSQLSDKTVQIDGTFGTATAVVEGSNDGTSYFNLTDPAGAPISTTVAMMAQILQNPKFIRPRTSGGGGGVTINIRLVERSGHI